MAREDGTLSKDDEHLLANIHDHALKIASMAMRRIKLGSDLDGHPNSWWRNYDQEIQQQTDFLNSAVKRFNR